jgi:hypothetical protein
MFKSTCVIVNFYLNSESPFLFSEFSKINFNLLVFKDLLNSFLLFDPKNASNELF